MRRWTIIYVVLVGAMFVGGFGYEYHAHKSCLMPQIGEPVGDFLAHQEAFMACQDSNRTLTMMGQFFMILGMLPILVISSGIVKVWDWWDRRLSNRRFVREYEAAERRRKP